MKILIAEDDLTSRIMLAGMLAKWAYEVIGTADGEAAWQVLQAPDAPQIAMLDWEMPKLDGLSLCRRLRSGPQPAPLYLILLTARSHRKDIIEGLEAGADDYIAKPYDNDELRARVNVGRRMIMMQNELRQREKLQGVLEMAGAVCHELNQPMQAISGFSELLLMEIPQSDPKYAMLKNIKTDIHLMGQLTRKIMKISKCSSKGYMDGRSTIIDIDKSASYEKLSGERSQA